MNKAAKHLAAIPPRGRSRLPKLLGQTVIFILCVFGILAAAYTLSDLAFTAVLVCFVAWVLGSCLSHSLAEVERNAPRCTMCSEAGFPEPDGQSVCINCGTVAPQPSTPRRGTGVGVEGMRRWSSVGDDAGSGDEGDDDHGGAGYFLEGSLGGTGAARGS